MQGRECIPSCTSFPPNQGQSRVCFWMMQPNSITAVQKLTFYTLRILENFKLQSCSLFQTSIEFSLINTSIVFFPYCIARYLICFAFLISFGECFFSVWRLSWHLNAASTQERLMCNLFLYLCTSFHFTYFHRAMDVNCLVIERNSTDYPNTITFSYHLGKRRRTNAKWIKCNEKML